MGSDTGARPAGTLTFATSAINLEKSYIPPLMTLKRLGPNTRQKVRRVIVRMMRRKKTKRMMMMRRRRRKTREKRKPTEKNEKKRSLKEGRSRRRRRRRRRKTESDEGGEAQDETSKNPRTRHKSRLNHTK